MYSRHAVVENSRKVTHILRSFHGELRRSTGGRMAAYNVNTRRRHHILVAWITVLCRQLFEHYPISLSGSVRDHTVYNTQAVNSSAI